MLQWVGTEESLPGKMWRINNEGEEMVKKEGVMATEAVLLGVCGFVCLANHRVLLQSVQCE